MTAKAKSYRRYQANERALLLLPLAITPSLGLHVISRLVYGNEILSPELAIAVTSTVFHTCLIAIVPLRREGDGLRVVVLSALALTLLAFAGPLVQNLFLSPELGAGNLSLIWLGLSWALGAVLVALLQTLSRGLPELGEFGGTWMPKASHAFTSVSLLAAAFWLLGGLDTILTGDIPASKGIGNAALLAILPVVAAGITRRSLGLLKRYQLRRMHLLVFATFGCSVLIVLASTRLFDLDFLGRGSSSILLTTTIVLALVLIAHPMTDFAASTMLTISAVPLSIFTLSAELPARGLVMVLLLAVLGAMFFQPKERQSLSERGILVPNSAVLGALQDRLGAYILHVNFDQRMVQFPFGGGAQFGAEGDLSLTEFFRLAPMKGVLDLMQKLQRGETPSGLKLQFRLRKRGPQDARQEWTAQPFTVHVIENQYPSAWIALARESHEAEHLAEQGDRLTSLLSMSLKREDHILIALAQDLRAPIAALSGLIDSFPPETRLIEARPAINRCLQMIGLSLDGLQFGPDLSQGSVTSGNLSLRELARRLEDQFQDRMAGAGQILRISLPHHADLALRADHGSVQVSLARLFENIVQHSGATEISLSAFVTLGEGDAVEVAWHLSDNGAGMTADQRTAVFDPLAPVSRKPGGRIGLGVYAARQSMRSLGGDLVLQASAQGSHLVLRYPAIALAEQQDLGREDARLHLLRASALLIAEDPAAADLPLTSLLRLFGDAQTVPDLTAAREFLSAQVPDIIFLRLPDDVTQWSPMILDLTAVAPKVPIVLLRREGQNHEGSHLANFPDVRVVEVPIDLASLRRLALEFIDISDGATAAAFSPEQAAAAV